MADQMIAAKKLLEESEEDRAFPPHFIDLENFLCRIDFPVQQGRHENDFFLSPNYATHDSRLECLECLGSRLPLLLRKSSFIKAWTSQCFRRFLHHFAATVEW